MAMQQCRLLVLVALLAGRTLAQSCDYSNPDGNCINAEATASVKMEFKPLFNSTPNFVFGIDNMEDKDIQNMVDANHYIVAPPGNDPAQAVAWWIEYDDDMINLETSTPGNYYVWALESNSTNDIGGNDGGCEELLGTECVSDLKSLFTGVQSVDESLLEFFKSPPERINCPTIIWGDGSDQNRAATLGTAYATPLEEPGETFARKDKRSGLAPPSGNASYTHSIPRMRYRSLEEQKSISVIGFNLGVLRGGADTIINMACLRVGKAPKKEQNGSDNAATSKSVSWTVALGFVASFWAFIISF